MTHWAPALGLPIWEFVDFWERKEFEKINRLINPFRMDLLFEDSRTINVRFTDEVLRIKSAVQVGYYSGRFSKWRIKHSFSYSCLGKIDTEKIDTFHQISRNYLKLHKKNSGKIDTFSLDFEGTENVSIFPGQLYLNGFGYRASGHTQFNLIVASNSLLDSSSWRT